MAMHFGPVSNDGGERRLNVLITRARDACRVYSSIRAGDIDLNRARARGAQALKSFLEYAESGSLASDAVTGRPADSEFEVQIATALAAHGWVTHAQVGVAGFFVDLAVVDPECAGRYLLGIECDGENYRSARSARDRDRIRPSVLVDRGWTIHRVWSVDWFHRPGDELQRLLGAIEEAHLLAERPSPPESVEQAEPIAKLQSIADLESIQRHAASDDNQPGLSEPYKLASFRVPTDAEIHRLTAAKLGKIISKVVDVEGPIHREEVARRVAQLWGLQRTGRRVRDAVDLAIEAASRKALRRVDDDFLISAGPTDCPIRDRSDVEHATLRKPEMLPPTEIRRALAVVAEVHLGAEPDDTVVETARLLGFRSTSPQLRDTIEREMESMLRDATLVRRNGKVYLSAPAESARSDV